MKQHYDVVIVGGGMVGASLAVALAQQEKLQIAVVEAQQPDPIAPDSIFDLRVSALTRSSEIMLDKLGIWSQIPAKRVSAFTDMRVWESGDDELHFSAADMGDGPTSKKGWCARLPPMTVISIPPGSGSCRRGRWHSCRCPTATSVLSSGR